MSLYEGFVIFSRNTQNRTTIKPSTVSYIFYYDNALGSKTNYTARTRNVSNARFEIFRRDERKQCFETNFFFPSRKRGSTVLLYRRCYCYGRVSRTPIVPARGNGQHTCGFLCPRNGRPDACAFDKLRDFRDMCDLIKRVVPVTRSVAPRGPYIRG